MKRTILLFLICWGICGCAQKQPDPYKEAGYTRFPSSKPHILSSTPTNPFSIFPMMNELQRRSLMEQERNRQIMNQYYQGRGAQYQNYPNY